MSRRLRVLKIGANFLPSLFGRDLRVVYEVMQNGLPPDATVVNAQMRIDVLKLHLLIQSDEFDEVAEGLPIPEIEPRFRQIVFPERTALDPAAN